MQNIFFSFGAIDIIVFIGLYLVLFFTALYFLAKRERNGGRFLGWLLVLIFFPFLGALFYICIFANNRWKQNQIMAKQL